MRRAVAYCRVSTKGQVGEDKYGIDAQREQIAEYCATHEIEVIRWYIDEGVSGAELHRPALDRLLAGEETNPPIECVVAAKADRISRDVTKYHVIKFLLQEQGIEIISASEDWNTQDQLMAMILENFLAMVAEIEKTHIRNRMAGGRAQKAAKGGYAGGKCPTGYSSKDGQYIVNEEEAEVVRFAFRCKEEGLTLRATADALTAAGYKTRGGKPFQYSTVKGIWDNEKTYRGWYRYGKDGEWVKGQHEAILKDED